MGIRLMDIGCQPKWEVKDIPMMPKVLLNFGYISKTPFQIHAAILYFNYLHTVRVYFGSGKIQDH